jgi:hypothetical protein
MALHHAPSSPTPADSPFDTLESAREYVGLLVQEVDANLEALQDDIDSAIRAGAGRRVDALRLAEFRLKELARHMGASRRILNDLRMLHRLLTGPGEPSWAPGTRASSSRREQSLDAEA